MDTLQTPLPESLKDLLDANLILESEARALSRLPEELHEKAMLQADALRGQNMQKIVSDLLNPSSVSGTPVPANASSSSELIEAAGDDLTNGLFSRFGNVGWVARKHLRGIWQSQKGRSWWKWMLALWIVSYFWRPIWHPQPPERQDLVSDTPVPTDALELPVPTAHKITQRKPSAGTQVSDTKPLPLAPVVIPQPPPLEKGDGGILQPPAEVHAEVKTPDLIILRWRPVGKNVTYNMYSSEKSDLSKLRLENEQPMDFTQVDWTPETGKERYWVVVTSLDKEGHESAYSEPIEVVRHPDKSGSNIAADEAVGILRRVVPW